MTKQEQKKFVNDLIRLIKCDLITDINNNKLPPEWDGHELRVLIADSFEYNGAAISLLRRYPRSARVRAFENHCLCNNLP